MPISKARDSERLTGRQLLELLCPNYIELHGDRLFGDDPAIIGGLAKIHEEYVTIIAQNKGASTEERLECNFGMAHPEGFRKAKRLIKQAEKFNRPVILIMDTAGAYPGIGAEERSQGDAIAQMLYELSDLKVPIISILLSEGGSGGALALGLCDHLLMFEHGFYSVISPEGFNAILYKGELKVDDVVDQMKITADHLLDFGIVDELIAEPKSGLNVENYQLLIPGLRSRINELLTEYMQLSEAELIEKRYERFRKFGRYE